MVEREYPKGGGGKDEKGKEAGDSEGRREKKGSGVEKEKD